MAGPGGKASVNSGVGAMVRAFRTHRATTDLPVPISSAVCLIPAPVSTSAAAVSRRASGQLRRPLGRTGTAMFQIATLSRIAPSGIVTSFVQVTTVSLTY